MAPDLFPSDAHDAGGRSVRRWPDGSRVEAQFAGPNDCFRLKLSCRWDAILPLVLWVMMNPSVANTRFADPTIAKTIAFTMGWKSTTNGPYGGVLIGNVHAYRATDHKRLLAVDDPVGPGNDQALLQMARQADITVLAYGKPHMRLRPRGMAVARMLMAAGIDLRVLRQLPDGTPQHPLYIPGGTLPTRFDPLHVT